MVCLLSADIYINKQILNPPPPPIKILKCGFACRFPRGKSSIVLSSTVGCAFVVSTQIFATEARRRLNLVI